MAVSGSWRVGEEGRNVVMKHHYLMLVALAFATTSIFASAVRAEEGRPKERDVCIPHSKQQGFWHCDLKSLNEIKCEGKAILGLYDDWKVAHSRSGAFEVIRNKYRELNDARAFKSWLNCQGFRLVYAGRLGRTPIPNTSSASVSISAEFKRSEVEPYPITIFNILGLLGWYEYERFVIQLDDYGQIGGIQVFKTL